jgi:hypothetical protein
MTLTLTDRLLALAATLEIDPEGVEPSIYGDANFEAEGAEYLVLTYDEAKAEVDECLESYCDEFVLDRLPADLQCYFDAAAWKRDQWLSGLNMGEWLAHYDHHELESPCGTFHIFRTN